MPSLLTITALRDGYGTVVPAKLTVRLVDARGEPVVAFNETGLATVIDVQPLLDDTVVTLAPSTQLTAPNGGPVFYRVRITAERFSLDQVIIVPPGQSLLTDLLPPGSVWARDAVLPRLLPAIPDGAADGWSIVATGAPLQPAWSAVVPGSGLPEAPLSGGPYGRESGAWVEIEAGGGTGHDPVTLAGTLDYLTLAGQQITVGPIDLATDVTGSLPYAALSGAPTTWAWSAIIATPTTLAGYGIVDAGTAAPVQSVAGRTGAVTLTAIDVAGLAAVATSGAYADLSGRPTLGAAAGLNYGTSAGQLVQLDGSARLPAVDGSQLTGLPSGSNDATALRGVALTAGMATPGEGTIPVYRAASGGYVLEAKPASGSTPSAADVSVTPVGSIASNNVQSALAELDTEKAAAGDLHSAVTLAGTPTYLTIAGQVITRGLVNLASHVTGLLPWASVSGKPTSLSGYGITDAVASNDSRLSDARAPTAHAHASADITDATAAGRALLTSANAIIVPAPPVDAETGWYLALEGSPLAPVWKAPSTAPVDPPTGAVWDGGSTIWDGGSTVWDA